MLIKVAIDLLKTSVGELTDSSLPADRELWRRSSALKAEVSLKDQLKPLPEGLFPLVIAGGSFNNSTHRTQVKPEDEAFIDRLLKAADPEKVFFVVGHTLSGQEGYLARQAAGRFRLYAIVPNRITPAERNKLSRIGAGVIISIESTGMGLYKSFSYEIFRRMPSALLAFDGNASALNLIQEARNSRNKCRIYLNPRSRGLADKARLLRGYVEPLKDPEEILKELGLLKG